LRTTPFIDIRVDEDRIAALPEIDFDTSLPSAIASHDTDDWRLDSIVTSGEVMRGRGMMVKDVPAFGYYSQPAASREN